MEQIEVYFKDDSDLAEFEAIQKGYRLDVYVKVGDKCFNVNVYDMVRLKQDFDNEIANEGYYSIDPNLILVKEANREEIVITLNKVYKQKYFEGIKHVEHIPEELKRIQ